MRPAGLLLVLAACGPAAPRLSELEQDVFRPSCAFATCHASAGAANGLDLEKPGTWSRLVEHKASLDGKTLVVPGKPEQSHLYERLTTTMPPGAPLEQADLARVRDWIAAGARND